MALGRDNDEPFLSEPQAADFRLTPQEAPGGSFFYWTSVDG
jgi:hypothetical protein